MNYFLKRILLPAILAGMILVSCDPKKVFDEYRTIPGATWAADSVMEFSFSVARKTDNHNLYFNIRNDQKYGFSNLWLFVTLVPPAGPVLTDTTQVILAEPSGRWIGKGFCGVYDNRFIYRRNVYFPEPGRYSIRIRHGMRPEMLTGITDFGVRIEKVN